MQFRHTLGHGKIILQINAQSDTPPNILVFVADDAGIDFGCHGNQGIKTPNVDQLAENYFRK
ncbi:MAG: hypothetical protein AAF573_08145 [Bacteroidota bacterium]